MFRNDKCSQFECLQLKNKLFFENVKITIIIVQCQIHNTINNAQSYTHIRQQIKTNDYEKVTYLTAKTHI